jgi:hypothetical protein
MRNINMSACYTTKLYELVVMTGSQSYYIRDKEANVRTLLYGGSCDMPLLKELRKEHRNSRDRFNRMCKKEIEKGIKYGAYRNC